MSTICLQAALMATPVYGYISDQLTAGEGLLVLFAARAYACFTIYKNEDPLEENLVWMVAAFEVSANF